MNTLVPNLSPRRPKITRRLRLIWRLLKRNLLRSEPSSCPPTPGSIAMRPEINHLRWFT